MSESRFNLTVAVLLALVCGMAYVNTLDGEWVWDDASSVLLHRHVQDPGQFAQLFREDQHAFGRGQGNFYRPLVAASFMLDYYLSGGPRPGDYDARAVPEVSPLLFHISNMIWHLLAALLLLLLLHRLDAPRFVKATAPLLFVVHPLHTEAVTYISGRADMMSAVGVFAALFFAVNAIRLKQPVMGTVGATSFFVFGLLSKESTLIYPILLAVVFAVIATREKKRVPSPNGICERAVEGAVEGAEQEAETPAWWRLMPLVAAFAVLAMYILLRTTVLRFADSQSAVTAPLSTRLVETLQSLGVYAKLLFIPTGLHMERTLDNVSAGYIALGALFLVGLIAGITVSWRLSRQGQSRIEGQSLKRIAAGFAWFLAAWLPVSGIFPLNAPLAEHWMYVPMAGFWWALLEIVQRLLGTVPDGETVQGKNTAGLKVAYVGVFVLCVIFIVMTAQRNRDWHDNERLFRATLQQNPNSMRVHYNLAVTYDSIKGNYAGARRHYERYLELRARERAAAGMEPIAFSGDDIEARLSLGRVLLQLGEYAEAVNVLAPLKQLAEIDVWRPAAAMAAAQTGQALLALGDIGQAHIYFQEAMTINPELYAEIESILGGQPFYDGY